MKKLLSVAVFTVLFSKAYAYGNFPGHFPVVNPLFSVAELNEMPEVMGTIKSTEANFNVTCKKLEAGNMALLVVGLHQWNTVKCKANTKDARSLKIRFKFSQFLFSKAPKLKSVKIKLK